MSVVHIGQANITANRPAKPSDKTRMKSIPGYTHHAHPESIQSCSPYHPLVAHHYLEKILILLGNLVSKEEVQSNKSWQRVLYAQ